jgi:hypothetical protein
MRRTALAMALAGSFAMPAWGMVTAVSVGGYVDIAGTLGTIVGSPPVVVGQFAENQPRLTLVAEKYSLQNAFNSIQYGTVSAMASHISSFDLSGGGQLSGASFAGTAAITAATFAPMASALKAESAFDFGFRITGQSAGFSIVGSLTPLGAAAGPTLTLMDAGSSTVIAKVESLTAGTESFTISGYLPPGVYSLSAYVGETVPYAPPGVLARAYSMEYTFNIPEPMSLVLVIFGALVAARRRLT